jgi:hypothetical protein
LAAPGLPEGVPAPEFRIFTPETLSQFKLFTSQQVEEMAKIIEQGVQAALARYSIYTQAKPFSNYDIELVALTANVAARLDTESGRMADQRRVLLIVNPNATNILWVGKGSGIGLAQGIPVNVNAGTYAVSIEGAHNQHWGIIAADQNIPVITYW